MNFYTCFTTILLPSTVVQGNTVLATYHITNIIAIIKMYMR